MFGKDQRDLCRALSEMERVARDKCNANQIEAKATMAEWLRNDRRFDDFDPQRLIDRVCLHKTNGAQLDLSDPQLQRGGQPRPGDRRW